MNCDACKFREAEIERLRQRITQLAGERDVSNYMARVSQKRIDRAVAFLRGTEGAPQ